MNTGFFVVKDGCNLSIRHTGTILDRVRAAWSLITRGHFDLADVTWRYK